jgi:hypothetical protein
VNTASWIVTRQLKVANGYARKPIESLQGHILGERDIIEYGSQSRYSKAISRNSPGEALAMKQECSKRREARERNFRSCDDMSSILTTAYAS